MTLIKHKSDVFGAAASTLCLVHCMATPFLFLAHASFNTNEISNLWESLDYIFLAISFMAIYWSTKTTAKQWIKYILWGSWCVLLLIILNEKLQYLSIPEYVIYFPSISLIFFHYYNLKYCKCKNDSCCAN